MRLSSQHHSLAMAQSKVKQNFHTDSEALINKQINMELYASYCYLSMAAYFARDDVALHGFAKRFRAASQEEREHADLLIDYQNMRGGRVVFREIAKPGHDEWGTAVEATEATLELEKTVNESLLNLHKMADGHADAQMTDFIEGTFLKDCNYSNIERIKQEAVWSEETQRWRVPDLVVQKTKLPPAGGALGGLSGLNGLGGGELGEQA